MPAPKTPKTQAMRLLEAHGIPYQPVFYEVEEHLTAPEVAAVIGFMPEATFKTLVVLPERAHARPLLALIPATEQLDLKKLAAAAGEKKVQMAAHREAEQLTGLEKGGISPLALFDRNFPTFIDETVMLFDRIEISAGKVGVGVIVPVEPVVALLGATLVDLSVEGVS